MEQNIVFHPQITKISLALLNTFLLLLKLIKKIKINHEITQKLVKRAACNNLARPARSLQFREKFARLHLDCLQKKCSNHRANLQFRILFQKVTSKFEHANQRKNH